MVLFRFLATICVSIASGGKSRVFSLVGMVHLVLDKASRDFFEAFGTCGGLLGLTMSIVQ